MKKRLSFLLCIAFMLGMLAACSQQQTAQPSEEASAPPSPEATAEIVAEAEEAPTGMTPGTYTGAVEKAYHGPMSVDVTVNTDAITDIVVTENGETYGIGSVAVEQMPDRIMEAQSLGVDTLTGATISSGAILSAVKDALTQAGADLDAWAQYEKTSVEDATYEADVVVVGGGLGGLSAAVSAAENGAKVILLEKAGFTGGASASSGGEILAAGTSVQAAEGIEDSAQALVDYWLEKGEGNVNEELVRFVGLSSPDTIEWLMSMGTELSMDTPTSMPWQDPKRCHKTAEGVASTTGTGGGVGFTIPLTEKGEELGIQFLYETPAEKLLMDGAAVVGVEASTKQGSKVTVNAKTVILATGGFDGNDEMMKEHNPLVSGRSNLLGLHTGDGHRMAEEAGAEMQYHPSGVVFLATDFGPTFLGMADIFGQYLYVLPNGERFMNEADYWFMRSGNLIKNDVDHYWTILPSDSGVENMEAAVEAGTAVKGDSIEALAQSMDVDPAVLTATVSRYNEICSDKKDDDFGKTDANMQKLGIEGGNLNPIETGPFYAVRVSLASVSGSLGGPRINMQGQVMGTGGDVIKGLYATGEIANAEFYNVYYPCSGSSLQYCATMGRVAGETAAKEALN